MPTIRDLQQVFEDAPEHESSEVSKVEALRLLSPQILLMQSKGYNMAHIAAVLTERGVAVTAATLKSHLSRFKSSAMQEPLRTKRQPRMASEPTGVPPRVRTVVPARMPVPDTVASTASQPVPTNQTSEPAKQAALAAPRESLPRRSGFTVRPDTKDI